MRVNTISKKILNVEKLENVVILLSNKDILKFTNVMFISNLTVNLIFIVKLY